MKKLDTTKITAISATAVMASLGTAGILLGTTAHADDTTGSPTPSASSSQQSTTGADDKAAVDKAPGDKGPDGRGGPEGHGHGGGMDTATLAKKLGVDESKLRTAMREVMQANRPAKTGTDPGSMTQAQREAERTQREAKLAKDLAAKLGIPESKVTTAMNEMRSQARAERSAELQTRLSTAVKDGTLTQAEADAVKKAVDKGIIGPR